MSKKFWVIMLALVFGLSMSLLPVVSSIDAAGKCNCKMDGKDCSCGKGCACEHCKSGKGECSCHKGQKGHNGCDCGKDCKCEHCMTGKGKCSCKMDGKDCSCGKGCACEHCKTGKGKCSCHMGDNGCKCGKDCKCEHCAHGGDSAAVQKPSSESDYAKVMMSKAGAFKASYTSDPEAIPLNSMLSWKLKVETADGQPVRDAVITVSGDMPEHGHGLPSQPKVTRNLGDGSYLVEGIKFSMPGWWTMTFSIDAAGKTDSVTFNLLL